MNLNRNTAQNLDELDYALLEELEGSENEDETVEHIRSAGMDALQQMEQNAKTACICLSLIAKNGAYYSPTLSAYKEGVKSCVNNVNGCINAVETILKRREEHAKAAEKSLQGEQILFRLMDLNIEHLGDTREEAAE